MNTMLHVSASPRHMDSHSRKAAVAAIAELQEHRPAWQVIERDLALEPLPHPDAAFVQASLMPDALRNAAQRAVLRQSEQLIAELASADAIVLSTPMHNFTLPSVLKAWVDHVVRPRRTFRLDARGKTGLLHDRPVRVVLACGGSLVVAPGGTGRLRHTVLALCVCGDRLARFQGDCAGELQSTRSGSSAANGPTELVEY